MISISVCVCLENFQGRLAAHKYAQLPTLSTPSHRHHIKHLKAIISFKRNCVPQKALYNPTLHQLAVLCKSLCLLEIVSNSVHTELNLKIPDLSSSPHHTHNKIYKKTHALNKICTFHRILSTQRLYSFVHFEKLLFLPHGITWSS